MVAATFPNLSYENPPGTGPTLLSGSVEPFALANGDLLQLTFAGLTINVVFLTADFADISAATAAEVSAVIEAQVDSLGAADDGGAVRLTSLLTGEDIELEVAASGANAVLGFSTTAVNGETYAGGPPNGWTLVDEVDSVTEWADFTDENGRPEEIFDLEGWSVLSISDAFEDAIFDAALLPAPFETFTGWSTTGLLTSIVGVAAEFNTVAGLSVFESFEDSWGSPLYFEFLPTRLIPAVDNPETFETGWGQGGAVTYETAMFSNSLLDHEPFEPFNAVTHVVTVTTAANGVWEIEINGEVFPYTSSGSEPIADICIGLAAVAAGSAVANATAFPTTVNVSPVNANDELTVSARAPSGGAVNTVLATESTPFVATWVGQDFNPDFE